MFLSGVLGRVASLISSSPVGAPYRDAEPSYTDVGPWYSLLSRFRLRLSGSVFPLCSGATEVMLLLLGAFCFTASAYDSFLFARGFVCLGGTVPFFGAGAVLFRLGHCLRLCPTEKH